MSEWILLLRGVMPTGRNRVPMAPLRAALEAAGLRGVRTWIQSGNVIAHSRRGQASVERLVHDVIRETFGGDIAVLARPTGYVRDAVARNPFPDASPNQLFYTLLSRAPEPARLQALLAHDGGAHRIHVDGDLAFVHCAGRYSDTRLNNACIERKLAMPATTRVANTIHKLLELCDA
ncbi:MAG: DUF1697 domain-containing protein [Lysobacter sp.]|nr:DUF1697 domain-containing protein [Lysobacter sp.]